MCSRERARQGRSGSDDRRGDVSPPTGTTPTRRSLAILMTSETCSAESGRTTTAGARKPPGAPSSSVT